MIDYTTHPQYFGYYDSIGQTPAYDPEENAPCLICTKKWSDEDVRSISFTSTDMGQRPKSYFYRVHKSCHERLSPEHQQEFEQRMIDSVTELEDTHE